MISKKLWGTISRTARYWKYKKVNDKVKSKRGSKIVTCFSEDDLERNQKEDNRKLNLNNLETTHKLLANLRRELTYGIYYSVNLLDYSRIVEEFFNKIDGNFDH